MLSYLPLLEGLGETSGRSFRMVLEENIIKTRINFCFKFYRPYGGEIKNIQFENFKCFVINFY